MFSKKKEKGTSDKGWPTLNSRLQVYSNLILTYLWTEQLNKNNQFEKEQNVCVVIIMPINPNKKTLELARSSSFITSIYLKVN